MIPNALLSHATQSVPRSIEKIIGGSNDDVMTAGSTSVTLIGGAGHDSITGSVSLDTLDGGDGNDTLDGGASSDSLTGGDGHDSLTGGTSNDTLVGGAGNDYLDGGDHNDSVAGGDGDDTLIGGLGTDTLDGGAGDDVYFYTNIWAQDTITDASGSDTLDLSTVLNAALTVNLVSGAGHEASYGTNTINWTSDVIEHVIGGNFSDSITGNSAANLLDGRDGSDTLIGADGNDTLLGGSGNDSISGGADNDLLDGGAFADSLDGGDGDDTYRFSGTWSTDSITGDSSGTDTVDLSAVTANLTINLTSSGGHEITDGTNTVNWSSDVIENVLGGSGNDSITGSSGANALTGNAGDDTLVGGAGNDAYHFAQGDGEDTVLDSSGTDTIFFDNSIGQSVVAIFQTGGGDLQIGYTDSAGDLITVDNFATSGYEIERFELSTGYYMTDSDINQVIADLNTYATNNSITISSLDDVKNDSNLMAIVNAGWHT